MDTPLTAEERDALKRWIKRQEEINLNTGPSPEKHTPLGFAILLLILFYIVGFWRFEVAHNEITSKRNLYIRGTLFSEYWAPKSAATHFLSFDQCQVWYPDNLENYIRIAIGAGIYSEERCFQKVFPVAIKAEDLTKINKTIWLFDKTANGPHVTNFELLPLTYDGEVEDGRP